MKIAELILEYIRVLVYPISLLVVFFALQNQIRNILERITVAKYGNASLEIGGRNEATDQSVLLDYIKDNDGRLFLKELYSEAEKLLLHKSKSVGFKQLQKEKRRIDAAIEGLAQRGTLVKDTEGSIKVA